VICERSNGGSNFFVTEFMGGRSGEREKSVGLMIFNQMRVSWLYIDIKRDTLIGLPTAILSGNIGATR
jgi:hypothetical protein